MYDLVLTLTPEQPLSAYAIQNSNSQPGQSPAEMVVSSHHQTIVVRQTLRAVAVVLKLHSLTRMSGATDIVVVDRVDCESRFSVSYYLQSTTTNTRHTLSAWTSEPRPVLSLQGLYPAFNWAEREAWDMYGVFFVRHPDLRRILTDYGFTGFPLQKSFPLSGFKESQFEDSIKNVEYNNTELAQSYRLLSFNNSWPRG